MFMNDYVIAGDTNKYKGCLVSVCGPSLEHAQEVLHRMLNNPTDNDKKITEGMYNLRIKEVPEKDCWWHGNCE